MEFRDESMDRIQSIMSFLDDSNLTSSSDPLWTVEDVADYLKLQPETIRCMARRRELPALKIGKVWRFQRRAIDEMLVNMH